MKFPTKFLLSRIFHIFYFLSGVKFPEKSTKNTNTKQILKFYPRFHSPSATINAIFNFKVENKNVARVTHNQQKYLLIIKKNKKYEKKKNKKDV